MKLSVSNIAWDESQDNCVYRLMLKYGFSAVEIAPTRWFPEAPYSHLKEASEISMRLRTAYGLSISSLQSIWYGRQEKLFGSCEERRILFRHTYGAIEFAQAVGAGNLVFGCPRNRVRPDGADESDVLDFFAACGDEAVKKGIFFSLEANPPIYNTNYINTTQEAFLTARKVNSPGCKVNVDIGAMIYYNEPISLVENNLSFVSHVHVSEVGLVAPCHVKFLNEIIRMLQANGYTRYISIEMGKACGIQALDRTMGMLAELTQSV